MGQAGTSGAAGRGGTIGTAGVTGIAGEAGGAGTTGSSGASGAAGAAGAAGATGAAGRGGAGGAAAGAGGSGGAGQCPATATATPGEKSESVTVGGMTRTFLRHIPTGYTGKTPVPVVIDYHPLGGTGSSWKASTNWSSVADSQGFIMIWPDGVGNAWNVGRCCGDRAEPERRRRGVHAGDHHDATEGSLHRSETGLRDAAARTAAGWPSRSRATPPT